jgi:hypothetical protein
MPWCQVQNGVVQGFQCSPDDAQGLVFLDESDPLMIEFRANGPLRQLRAAAVGLLSGASPLTELQRATFLTLLDQLNTIATQHNNLLTWLGTQTTLAQRAQLSGFALTAGVTPAQAKAAVVSKINDGSAD